VRGVALVQVFLGNVGHPAQALGDVIPRHFYVEPPRPGAQGVVHVEESPKLRANRVEVSRLVPAMVTKWMGVRASARVISTRFFFVSIFFCFRFLN